MDQSQYYCKWYADCGAQLNARAATNRISICGHVLILHDILVLHAIGTLKSTILLLMCSCCPFLPFRSKILVSLLALLQVLPSILNILFIVHQEEL